MNRTFERAPNKINARQARSLARLLERGEHTGTTYPAVERPDGLAFASIGEPCDGPFATLAVMDALGRAWQITTRGIVWPIGFDPRADD